MSLYLMVDTFLTFLLEMGLKWNRRYGASWLSGDSKVCGDFHQVAIYLLLVEMEKSCNNPWEMIEATSL